MNICRLFLVNVKDENGKSIVSGRRVTSFGNEEEEQIKLTDAIPFLVETRLKELGGKFEKNEKLWGPHVTVDGQRSFLFHIFLSIFFQILVCLVILGANPASAHDFGVAILNAINKK